MSGLFKSVGNILGSVAQGISSVVQAAVNDPIGTIAKVAAVATGNAWAIPLISGADTIAHGGSIGDALKSAGTSYVAGAIAPLVSNAVSGAVGDTIGTSAGNTVGNIAGNMAGSIASGGNPLNALVSGGIGAGVSELSNQIPGFDSLPAMAQNAIKSAMTSSLSSSLVSGQAPTQENISAALAAGQNAATQNSTAQANSGTPTSSAMYTGEKLIAPKLATVGPTPTAATSPLNALSPPGSILGNTAPGNVLGGTNNLLGGESNIPVQNNAYGMGNMNSPGNVYGMTASQNQPPMYARGGLVYLADGGKSDDDTKDNSNDWMASLKSLGDLTGPAMSKQAGLMRVGKMGSDYSPMILPQLAALLQSRGMKLAHGGQPDDHEHPNYDGSPVFRTGGLEGLGGKYVEGKGDGTSDDISAMLANGEYVFSADVVSALGNGSNKAGADRLGEMVEAIRHRARSSSPDKLPPDAKSPLEYLKLSRGNKHG